jgi:small-conductance mechanosensitive channel
MQCPIKRLSALTALVSGALRRTNSTAVAEPSIIIKLNTVLPHQKALCYWKLNVISILLSLLLFLILLPCAPITLAAQQTQPTESPEQITQTIDSPEQIVAIPMAEVAKSANEAVSILRGIRANLEPDPSVTRMRDGFSEYIELLQDQKNNPEAGIPEKISWRSIDNVRQLWSRYKKPLDDWDAILKDRLEELETERTRANELNNVWQKTKVTAIAEEAAESLNARIDTLLEEVQAVRKQIRQRTDDLLALQHDILGELGYIAGVFDRLDAAQQETRELLYVRDSPPLWKAFQQEEYEDTLTTLFAKTWQRNLASIETFFDLYRDTVFVQLVFFVLLLISFIALRTKSREWQDEENIMHPAKQLFEHPVALAFLVTLSASRWFYPRAALLIIEINSLMLLLSVLRLLPNLLPANMRNAVYALSIPLALDIVSQILIDNPLLQRLFILMLTLSAIAILTKLIFSFTSKTEDKANLWWHAAVLVTKSSVIILSLSVVSNILGNVSLSEWLSTTIIGGIFAAVIVYGIVLVLDGMMYAVIKSQTTEVLNTIRKHHDLLNRRFRKTIHAAAVVIWCYYVLDRLRLLQPVLKGIGDFMVRKWVVGTVELSLGAILAFIFTLWLSVQLSRFLRFILDEDVLPRFKLRRGVAGAISIMVHYALIGFGLVIAFAAAGIELSQFALMAGALGVGIGFGLQNVVNNFISGLILIFERPIQRGDTIQLTDLMGKVKRIGIRSSTIRTFDGAEVIVPNGNLVSAEVTNWTLSDKLRRIDVTVGVAYGTDPKKVIEILEREAGSHEEVLEEPEPIAFFRNFGESSLDFLLRFWTANFDNWWKIQSDVNVAVNDALKKARIIIPFPQRDLHVRPVADSIKRAVNEKKVRTTRKSPRSSVPRKSGKTEG